MDVVTTGFHDDHTEPHARRNRFLAITVSMLCYASILLVLYASSQLLG